MKTSMYLALIATLALAGCNTLGRQPRLDQAGVQPAVLAPGDSAVISVKVSDKYGIIKNVQAEVKGEQTAQEPENRVIIHLYDNGEAPDAKSGDGIWTSSMLDVPLNAPSGQFTFLISAYNEQGSVVIVSTEQGDAPLETPCQVEIKYPAEPVPPSPAEPK